MIKAIKWIKQNFNLRYRLRKIVCEKSIWWR